ncbi:MAG: Gordonia phage Lambo, partial [Bacteroidota bacterium]
GKSLIADTEITRLASVTNVDISGKVDKEAGKSLIADTEITRLASVTNVDISGKVDKEAGKSLIADTEIARLASVENVDISGKVDKEAGKSLIADTEITRLASVTNVDISGKVDKVAGKSLIADTEITRLANAPTKTESRSELFGWNKILIFGDSRIGNESATIAGVIYSYNRGPVNWANAILDRRFEIVSNKGVGGDTTTAMLVRYDTDIKPFAGIAKILYMMVDVNDVNATTPAISEATTKANLLTLYNKMTEDGFFIIDVAGYYPATAFTAAKQRVFQNIAQFKKIQANSRRNLRVIDYHAIIGNVTSTTPNTPSNMFFNDGTGLHVGVRGAQLLGIELAKLLQPLCPKTEKLITSAGDFRTTSDNTISKNLILNPLMVGTAGVHHPSGGTVNDATPDVNFTAGVVTGFTARRNAGAGSASFSVGTNPNFIGQVQRIKITGETLGTTSPAVYQLAPTNSVHSIITRNVPLVAKCKVQLSNIAFVHSVVLRILYTLDGVNYGSRDMADTNYVGGAITKDCLLTLETLPITIAAGSLTNCEAQIQVIFDQTTGRTGTLNLDIGQFSFEELA